MAVAYRSNSIDSYAVGSGGGTITVLKPSGTIQGDLIIIGLAIVIQGSSGWGGNYINSVPSGFSLIRIDQSVDIQLAIYAKVAGGSEPASYNFGFSSSSPYSIWAEWIAASYSGVSPSYPYYGAQVGNPTVTNPTGLSETIQTVQSKPIAFLVKRTIYSSTNVTAGWTLRGGAGQSSPDAGYSIGLYDAAELQSGSTGNVVDTFGTGNAASVGKIELLKPNVPPSTPTGLQETSPNTSTTPTFSAVVTDPDGNQVKARFEIYQNDGTTLIGTVDSGFAASGSTLSATYSSALPVGTYKVRAQGIDDSASGGTWTSLLTFTVVTTVNKDSIYLWNVADPTTPRSKDSILIWNVVENKAKQLGLIWIVYQRVVNDLSLKWNIGTPWTKVTEDATTWTGVPEG
jgi:hypothetical protein